MFVMSVNINCCLEDPRLFKTHQGAIDAMFEVLDGYAYNCCSYAAENVRKELRAIKTQIDKGVESIDKRVDGWVDIFVTQYGASICFTTTTTYDGYDGCEVNIMNMDEIEVEE